MNKYKSIIVVVLLTVSACQPNMVKTDGALRTLSESNILPLGGHAHQFPLDSSVRLIANLAHASPLSGLASGYGWGGSFPASAFKVSPENQGILLWYCFRGGSDPHVFLALEQLKDYDPENLPRHPLSSELIGPTAIFRKTFESVPDESTVRQFMMGQKEDNSGWVTFAREEVIGYIDSADSLFRENPDTNGERYNNYMFGFFSVRHEADFDAFIARAGANGFVHYYFGYEEGDRPNRIRIILTIADSHGAFRSSSRTNDGGNTMQRSWPPPPDN